MARRTQTITAHPDTEQAAAELSAIVGEKSTAQAEILGLAQNKKELIETSEQEKNRLESELEVARKELDQFLYDSEQKHRNIQAAIVLAEDIRDEVTAGNKKLEQRKLELEPQVAALDTKKQKLTESVADLEVIHADLKRVTAEKVKELSSHSEKKAELEKDIKDLEQKKADRHREHTELSAAADSHALSVKDLTDKKNGLEKEIVELDKTIGSKKENLAALQTDETTLQEKVNAHAEEISKENARINERLGILAHAENRAEHQLELLKEAKSHFTSEQLLRVGIRD